MAGYPTVPHDSSSTHIGRRSRHRGKGEPSLCHHETQYRAYRAYLPETDTTFHGGTKSIGKVYPSEVNGIRIDSKASKIHFLIGSVFSTDMTKGKTTAKFIINFEDGSTEEFSLIAKVDVFDYWIHTKERREAIESVNADKIGWIGESSNGDARALTKYSWKNPHPDKKVSHIDFEGGLSETAPFIVAITIE